MANNRNPQIIHVSPATLVTITRGRAGPFGWRPLPLIRVAWAIGELLATLQIYAWYLGPYGQRTVRGDQGSIMGNLPCINLHFRVHSRIHQKFQPEHRHLLPRQPTHLTVTLPPHRCARRRQSHGRTYRLIGESAIVDFKFESIAATKRISTLRPSRLSDWLKREDA